MTEDPFLNVVIGICAVSVLCFAWIWGKAGVANDCRTMGVTNIGGAVFECKEKNT